VPNYTHLYWRFPSGARVKFAHIQHAKDVQNWAGSQMPLIAWDQLEHFGEKEFFFLLSRNRSMCGVRPYVRASCNPDPSSWIAEFISWWLDEDGFPNLERAGQLRWFIRKNEDLFWADTPEELQAKHGADAKPRSVTFVPARVEDNPALLEKSPEYLANLEALPYVDQQRLRWGNWKISLEGREWPPSYFDHIWVDAWPECVKECMALDPSKGPDAQKPDPAKGKLGDFSAFVRLGIDIHGTLYCEANLARRPINRPDGGRFGSGIIEDGLDLFQLWGPSGFAVEANQFQSMLLGEFLRVAKARKMLHLPLFAITNTENKPVRIRTLGTYLAQGKLKFRNTPGTRMLVQQLRDFPVAAHDDGPDALEMALRLLKALLGEPGERRGRPERVRLAA
jgi:predicted phage terminase large subunit-like protein